MILESAPGQFVELPEDIFKSIWKRGVNSFSAPLDTSVTRKERMAGIGQILSPLCTAWCVYLPWLCIPLFKANTERQCTIWDFINFWRSILLQLLFCSKVKATLTRRRVSPSQPGFWAIIPGPSSSLRRRTNKNIMAEWIYSSLSAPRLHLILHQIQTMIFISITSKQK